MPVYERGLMWFRRDLRFADNAALYHALTQCAQVWCVFVLDTCILDALPRSDRRVEFILAALHELNTAIAQAQDAQQHAAPNSPNTAAPAGAGLIVCHGQAHDEIARLMLELSAQALFTNHDDEPQALLRDEQVKHVLAEQHLDFFSFKDHVIFERDELLTQSGKPYTVFTPYKNAWLKKITPFHCQRYPTERYAQALAPRPPQRLQPVPSLRDIGFEPSNLSRLKIELGRTGALRSLQDFLPRLDRYEDWRNFPAIKGPSYLSVHLRFGTLSIRELVQIAWNEASGPGSAGAGVWLSELIWRDFYFQILSHYPHVVGACFKTVYDRLIWVDEQQPAQAKVLFAAWCEGKTGYPLVDAAMAQLRQTGYMHNRLRMVVASFLVKDLGLNWRWGEAFFALHLNDFDLAANNGGWQWAASTGCDAQPWFRIFNPTTQSEKFDADGQFICRYLPQLSKLPKSLIHAPWLASTTQLTEAGLSLGLDYPLPVVDHAKARLETLARYGAVDRTKAAA
jgi:deoxyribodipyrimidine photo-lyase